MVAGSVPVARRQLPAEPAKLIVAIGRFKEVAALARDPVCGMLVEPERAVRLEWEGETFYFCADGCRDQFERESASARDTLRGYSQQGASP
jgi:Cu+-exporting ATPase